MDSLELSQPSHHTEFCPGCGSQLVFDPVAGRLACPYCQTTVALAVSRGSVQEQDFEEWVGNGAATLAPLSQSALEVECSGCRAQITFEPPEVAGQCPFCGTHITASPRAANPAIAPGGILPFQLDQSSARNVLSHWLKTRWFAPSSLKTLAQHEKMQGVYLPFWTFDCSTRTQYTGQRGTYYYVKKTVKTRNSSGEWVETTTQERRTKWHPVSGEVQRFFDDVLVSAVELVETDGLMKLMPWSLRKVAVYDPRFLQGFRAQRSQVTLQQGFERAKGVMQPQIQWDIQSNIGGDEQKIHSQTTKYSDRAFKHLLLPVWMATYRYRNQIYQVLINGETGKIVGDRPYSVLKIAVAASAALLTSAAMVWGYTRFIGAPEAFAPESPAVVTDESPPVPETPSLQPTDGFGDGAMREALGMGAQAANQTQIAQTPEAWRSVAALWSQAIAQLQQIPESDPQYQRAQLKIAEYQRNLDYARRRATP